MTEIQDIAFFDAEKSGQLFAERLGGYEENQLADTLGRVVLSLHSMVREIRPSKQDWQTFIEFLTDIGNYCSERRQEWLLVSVLLGISSLVDALNSSKPKKATLNTIRGAYYRPNVSLMKNGENICLDGNGTPVKVTLKIRDLHGHPVKNAKCETWQANEQGFYENQYPDLQPEFNLRGHFLSNGDGEISYQTIKPMGTTVPNDGPLGSLLQMLGISLLRPAHLNFKICADGFEPLTTQIFDADDPNLTSDPLFSVKSGLLGKFEKLDDSSEESLSLGFEFVLCPKKNMVRQ